MKEPKILVYCGVHKCDSFGALVPQFDVCYGFEADPQLATEAKLRFSGNPNVHIVHAALCETSGTIVLNIHDSAGATSLGRLGEAYRSGTGNEIYPVSQVEVPAINLHDYLVSRAVDHIDLYQSDIQGMDFAVLNTLEPMIKCGAIKTICCETERDVHEFQSYEGLPSNRQARFNQLLENNYRVTEMQQVMANWNFQDVTWTLKPLNRLRWQLRKIGLIKTN